MLHTARKKKQKQQWNPSVTQLYIYIYIHIDIYEAASYNLFFNRWMNAYIYIYVCVCVCVSICVRVTIMAYNSRNERRVLFIYSIQMIVIWTDLFVLL